MCYKCSILITKEVAVQNLASSEFEILKLLWANKQMSGREIHEKISADNGWAYSTTRTTVERMVKKNQLMKENCHGIFVYSANVSKVKAFASQIALFAEKILESDAASVVPLFAKNGVLSAEEISELKKILAKGEYEK